MEIAEPQRQGQRPANSSLSTHSTHTYLAQFFRHLFVICLQILKLSWEGFSVVDFLLVFWVVFPNICLRFFEVIGTVTEFQFDLLSRGLDFNSLN